MDIRFLKGRVGSSGVWVNSFHRFLTVSPPSLVTFKAGNICLLELLGMFDLLVKKRTSSTNSLSKNLSPLVSHQPVGHIASHLILRVVHSPPHRRPPLPALWALPATCHFHGSDDGFDAPSREKGPAISEVAMRSVRTPPGLAGPLTLPERPPITADLFP